MTRKYFRLLLTVMDTGSEQEAKTFDVTEYILTTAGRVEVCLFF